MTLNRKRNMTKRVETIFFLKINASGDEMNKTNNKKKHSCYNDSYVGARR